MQNKLRTIIIDDTRTNLLLFEAILTRLDGHYVVPHQDPEAAVADCLTTEPDLVIVDLMMPRMSGHEVIRQLRARYPYVPILMVTASADAESRQLALDLGANDFLTKPVNQVELATRVRNMLQLRQAHLVESRQVETLAAAVQSATAELRQRERESLLCLSRAAEYRDPETGAHIERMAQYSAVIAKKLGLPTEECELILAAAPMHDIGKVGIADAILLKPGKLTDDEFAVMQTHATIGQTILQSAKSPIMSAAAVIAGAHHEKYDGSGYPCGLAGEAIPLHGRIVAVADVFDALTSERPYKRAWDLSEAIGHIYRSSGSHFDPACVQAFIQSIPEILVIQARLKD